MRITSATPLVLSLGLAAMLLLAGCQTARPTERVIARGEVHEQDGDLEAAIAEYRSVIDERPGSRSGRFSLGRALVKAGEPLEAREHLEFAHALRPTDDAVTEWLLRSMVESGDAEAAIMLSRSRVDDDPSSVARWIQYGDVLQGSGDDDLAEQAYLTASRASGGESIDAHVALASFYERLGDRPKAVQRLRMAYWLDRDSAEVRERLESLGEVVGPTLALQPAEMDAGTR
ncbi:MAG: hypothetical protein AAGD00_11495 [Planctomycetota bacterium]